MCCLSEEVGLGGILASSEVPLKKTRGWEKDVDSDDGDEAPVVVAAATATVEGAGSAG